MHRTVRFGVHPPTRAAKMKKSVGQCLLEILWCIQYISIIYSCTYHTPISLSEPLSLRPAISESVKESFLILCSWATKKASTADLIAKQKCSTRHTEVNEMNCAWAQVETQWQEQSWPTSFISNKKTHDLFLHWFVAQSNLSKIVKYSDFLVAFHKPKIDRFRSIQLLRCPRKLAKWLEVGKNTIIYTSLRNRL